MADGQLVYRSTVDGKGILAGRLRKGDIVRVRVRDCPDPAVARSYVEDVFRDVLGDKASVAWQHSPPSPR